MIRLILKVLGTNHLDLVATIASCGNRNLATTKKMSENYMF
jgi:hypothetical protein